MRRRLKQSRDGVTAEDIRRSGATTFPELFRMVPGMDVARIDNNKWAVSARGFNDRFNGKLLVPARQPSSGNRHGPIPQTLARRDPARGLRKGDVAILICNSDGR